MTGEEFLTPESVEPLRRALGASAARFAVLDPAAARGEAWVIPLPSSAAAPDVLPTATLKKVRVVDRGRETVRWRFDAPAQVLRSGGRTGMVSRATPEMEALAATVVDMALRGEAVEYYASESSRMRVRPIPREQLRWGIADGMSRAVNDLVEADVLRRGRARGLVDAASDSLIKQRERRALDWLREVGQSSSYPTAADLGLIGVLPDGVGLDVEALFRSAEIPLDREVPGRAPALSDAAVVARIRAALPFEVTITTTREPFDYVLRVTLERAERRAIPWQGLAAVRQVLREFAPVGFVFVVRDAASLRGPRERATAPLAWEQVEPVTAETIRTRLDRAFKQPYPRLP